MNGNPFDFPRNRQGAERTRPLKRLSDKFLLPRADHPAREPDPDPAGGSHLLELGTMLDRYEGITELNRMIDGLAIGGEL